MKSTRSRAEWEKLIRSMTDSRTHPKEFASKHGLNLKTLRWWRSQLEPGASKRSSEGQTPQIRFARVVGESAGPVAAAPSMAPDPSPADPSLATVVRLEVGRVRIAVQAGCDRDTLTTLLRALGIGEGR